MKHYYLKEALNTLIQLRVNDKHIHKSHLLTPKIKLVYSFNEIVRKNVYTLFHKIMLYLLLMFKVYLGNNLD